MADQDKRKFMKHLALLGAGGAFALILGRFTYMNKDDVDDGPSGS